MPYITNEARSRIDHVMHNLVLTRYSPGELNYIITRLLLSQEPQTYEQYNSLIGVLEACKQEFYRRMVAPYEDKKMAENGDVFQLVEPGDEDFILPAPRQTVRVSER